MKAIEIHNLGNLPVAPLDSFLELQEDFKIPNPDRLAKLKMLILSRGFKYAFKAWKDHDGRLWIIDAHQRRKALIELRNAGFIIPNIPYEPIFAADKKEAVEEIAAYNSEFAAKNPDTVLFEKYRIDADAISRFNLGYEVKTLDLSALKTPLFNSPELNITDDDPDFSLPENRVFALPGDIFLLGEHRLLCGDCRIGELVCRLMDGKMADLIVTDPPYNVDYSGRTPDALKIRNDAMDNDSFGSVFLQQVFSVMFDVLKPGGAFYVFHADGKSECFFPALRNAGFHVAQCCVWNKNSFVLGRLDYHMKHEPVFYGWKPGAPHNWFADRKQTSVWNFDRPQRNDIHPTMKPVALLAYPIRNSSLPGQIVADFFSGSASTLIACRQIDRICYAMEIDPKFVSASVLRFINLFDDPVRLIRDGKLFAHPETLNIINDV
jgi:DNA modification methylase